MSNWLDILPPNERHRLREKYKMSAAAYEKLREKVKGPEDLEREMLWNEAMAKLKFGLETEPALKQALTQQIERDIAERGIENVLMLPEAGAQKLHGVIGQFEVTVEHGADNTPDQLVLVPEGNVQEKIPVKRGQAESYIAQMITDN